jgi:rhodanese-related sulfurtransferase
MVVRRTTQLGTVLAGLWLLSLPASAGPPSECEPGGLPAGGRFSAAGALDAGARARDESCFLSPADLRAWSEEAGLALVDIRTAPEFARVHAPGSLNISSRVLPYKEFLKARPTVLVSDHPATAELEGLCHALRKAGFRRVAALDGGLAAWPRSLGALEGVESGSDLAILSPQELFHESLYSHWLVVNASKREIDREILPADVLQSAIAYGARKFQIDVARAVNERRASGRARFVAVLDEDGSHHAEIAAALAELPVSGVFFVEGGVSGYVRFRNLRDLMVTRAQRRWVEGCGSRS